MQQCTVVSSGLHLKGLGGRPFFEPEAKDSAVPDSTETLQVEKNHCDICDIHVEDKVRIPAVGKLVTIMNIRF